MSSYACKSNDVWQFNIETETYGVGLLLFYAIESSDFQYTAGLLFYLFISIEIENPIEYAKAIAIATDASVNAGVITKPVNTFPFRIIFVNSRV